MNITEAKDKIKQLSDEELNYAANFGTETGEKRPRGRPKGSTKKAKELAEIGKNETLTQDKRAYNRPPTSVTYDPSDMKQTLAIINEFRKMAVNRPKTGEELIARFNQYLMFCAEVGFKPTMESLCVAGGFTREAFRLWKDGLRNGKDMQEAAQQIAEAFAAIDADLAMNNKVYPATYIFRANALPHCTEMCIANSFNCWNILAA